MEQDMVSMQEALGSVTSTITNSNNNNKDKDLEWLRNFPKLIELLDISFYHYDPMISLCFHPSTHDVSWATRASEAIYTQAWSNLRVQHFLHP
jgi:hypothetical protein